MVVGETHHFRKPPYSYMQRCFGIPAHSWAFDPLFWIGLWKQNLYNWLGIRIHLYIANNHGFGICSHLGFFFFREMISEKAGGWCERHNGLYTHWPASILPVSWLQATSMSLESRSLTKKMITVHLTRWCHPTAACFQVSPFFGRDASMNFDSGTQIDRKKWANENDLPTRSLMILMLSCMLSS